MGPLLIDPDELDAQLRGPGPPIVLDVRWSLGGPPGADDHRLGHIPGGQFVDLDRELSGAPGPGRHPLPEPGAFQQAMRRHGVSTTRPVVVHDAGGGMSAARAWWLLGYFGHPEVTVLDGGFRAWVAAGLPVNTGPEAAPAEGDFTATPGHRAMVDAEGARAIAEHGVLIDVRAAERYRGEVEPVDPVAGHIPGACNLPAGGNVAETGRFLPVDVLRHRFADTGVEPGVDVAVYCGSGVVAAQGVLALALTGTDAALYAGSWSEWITDPSRPVAR